MIKMAAIHHLKRRNGVWYYRRRIQEHLVEAFGKRVVQISLNTSDLKDAKRRREVLDLEWSAKFNGAEHSLQPSPALSTRSIGAGAAATAAPGLRCANRRTPPDTEEQKREIEIDIEMELDIISYR